MVPDSGTFLVPILASRSAVICVSTQRSMVVARTTSRLGVGIRGSSTRYFDYFNSRSRMALTVDTRTATEYGVVRTFAQGDFQFNNFGTSNNSVLGAVTSIPAGLSGTALDGVGGGYVAVEYVFIQFAGFTFGKSSSAYATPWNGYPGNNSSYLLGGHDTVTGVNNIQY